MATLSGGVVLSTQADSDGRTLLPINYIFDIIEQDTYEISSDITDHYVEDNTAIQDHWAQHPKRYTLKGLVAEKIYKRTTPQSDLLQANISKLGPVASFFPQVSSYAATVIAASRLIETKVNALVKQAKNIKAIFSKDQTPQDFKTQQQKVVEYLEYLKENRILVSVSGPYGRLENMAIESAVPTQGDSRHKSDVTVTLKQLRFTSVEIVPLDATAYKSRYDGQVAAAQNLGKVQGKKAELESIAYKNTFGRQ